MTDFHTHLDLYADPIYVARKANESNAFTFCMTTSPRAWQMTTKVFSGLYRVGVGIGLHPEVLHTKLTEVPSLLDGIVRTRLIGEVGMDGSPQYRPYWLKQREVFARTLQECSRMGNRIVSVHSRRAVDAVLDVIESYAKNVAIVLHWFSGTKAQLERATSLGCYFSANPLMLQSLAGRKLFSALPRKRMLLESDGPFATAQGQPIMPWGHYDLVRQYCGGIRFDEEDLFRCDQIAGDLLRGVQ